MADVPAAWWMGVGARFGLTMETAHPGPWTAQISALELLLVESANQRATVGQKCQ